MPPPLPGVVPIEVPLHPRDLLRAWQPESRRLLLPAPGPLRVQQRVAARISAVGLGAAATITGRVVGAAGAGGFHVFELAPDDVRLRAVERLVEIARGEVVEYQPRAPRFLAALPAVVRGPGGTTYMNTFSVSEHGCGLAWSGPVPEVGAAVDVRLGVGKLAASFRGVVASAARAGQSTSVGVRFESGARAAWAMMLADLERSGAPLA